MSVVTRFAPSPTGFLHIGGARTALFNYLFARNQGGQYRLRIEDTDAARSTEEAKAAILEGLEWLGLSPDGEVVYQSARATRHREVAQALLDKGAAYYCYLSNEELEALRAESRSNGQPIRSPWRDKAAEQAPERVKPVVRIKAPITEELVFQDAVQGEIRIPAGTPDDLVLLRADGSPTYMLAVVVDDYDMGITHVIRGDDHLNNTSRQILIYQAMGWDLPVFAHIPLIHGADGAKLSKRHGALSVTEYRDMGYLPEALRNYLLRLGFSHGDDEIISDAQAIEWFALESLNKAAARFDFDKLNDLNGHYIREAEDQRLTELCLPLLNERLEKTLSPQEVALMKRAMPSLKQRAKTLVQLADSALFYFRSLNEPEDEKAQKQLAEGMELMQGFIPVLQAHQDWNHDALFALAKAHAEAQGVKIGQLMAPVRVAITGSTGAPSMFEVMELLGKEETLERLKRVAS